MSTAEEALAAFARDLVEEIAAGRAPSSWPTARPGRPWQRRRHPVRPIARLPPCRPLHGRLCP
jgi:hypothetical protein